MELSYSIDNRRWIFTKSFEIRSNQNVFHRQMKSLFLYEDNFFVSGMLKKAAVIANYTRQARYIKLNDIFKYKGTPGEKIFAVDNQGRFLIPQLTWYQSKLNQNRLDPKNDLHVVSTFSEMVEMPLQLHLKNLNNQLRLEIHDLLLDDHIMWILGSKRKRHYLMKCVF